MEASWSRLKIGLVGNSNVGKTSLLRRQVQDVFTDSFYASIGIDFMVKNYQIGGNTVKAFLWDTAGAQRFRSLTTAYYRGMHAVLICFDLTNRYSFESLNKYFDEIQYSKNTGLIFIVGCKCDLQREVHRQQIQNFAREKGVRYLQTSAKENIGVTEAFREIVESIPGNEVAKEEDAEQIVKLVRKQRGSKVKTCC